MSELTPEQLQYYEDIGSKYGWVAPLTEEDHEYIVFMRTAFRQRGFEPGKATKQEYEDMLRVVEDEFLEQKRKKQEGAAI